METVFNFNDERFTKVVPGRRVTEMSDLGWDWFPTSIKVGLRTFLRKTRVTDPNEMETLGYEYHARNGNVLVVLND